MLWPWHMSDVMNMFLPPKSRMCAVLRCLSCFLSLVRGRVHAWYFGRCARPSQLMSFSVTEQQGHLSARFPSQHEKMIVVESPLCFSLPEGRRHIPPSLHYFHRIWRSVLMEQDGSKPNTISSGRPGLFPSALLAVVLPMFLPDVLRKITHLFDAR